MIVALSLAIQMALGAGLELTLPSSELVPTAGGGFRTVIHYGNQAIHTIVSQLVAILFAAYQAVCLTLLYFDLRIRKEGYDLEVAALGEQDAPFAELAEPELELPES